MCAAHDFVCTAVQFSDMVHLHVYSDSVYSIALLLLILIGLLSCTITIYKNYKSDIRRKVATLYHTATKNCFIQWIVYTSKWWLSRLLDTFDSLPLSWHLFRNTNTCECLEYGKTIRLQRFILHYFKSCTIRLSYGRDVSLVCLDFFSQIVHNI